MKTINKKGLLVLATLLTAVLMIGIPLSAAASPDKPSYLYLASGSSMNYVCSISSYTDTHEYSVHNGIEKNTITNTSTGPNTYYYNVTVSSLNNTAVNITVPTSSGMTSYSNLPISQAKYVVPFYSNTSKNVTLSCPIYHGYFKGLSLNYNFTLNYTKAVVLPYYKTPFGPVKATEYIIYEHTINAKANSTRAASYTNITGTVYVYPATDIILGLVLNYYSKDVSSGTTPANETYNAYSFSAINTLSSTNVVPIHTDYTGAYVGTGVAIVLLGAAMYYFYGRKPATPKQTGKQTEKQENNKDEKPKQ
ncbi:hypothetical protein [Ferroplasma sp.]|uniref:hypothetical protein n=1 Tax=Ferroplasma sp. TaxID=2591003 RepID=UPI0026381DD7|nr:hypothetical protein [Ferroplasma sp.]